ncbi:MAG: glycosyltransferase family 4 protein [Blastocatellia bacterium]
MNQTDIIHLTFKPPFIPGSYNRMVGEWLDEFSDLRQAAICYWNKALPPETKPNHQVILINEDNLSVSQRITLMTPERFRNRWFNGVARRQNLVYLWGAQTAIARLRPKLIVCHDNYKFGAVLRKQINWPCRLALVQHGLSYHLPTAQAMQLYSLKSFDVVWALTGTSYRFDRSRMAAYEPIVHVLPNAVDINRFRPASKTESHKARAQWNLPQDKLIVLSLSRLVAQKGAHVILQSWPEVLRQCPQAFLWIVGGGDADYESYLQSLIEAMKLSDSVRLQGAVTSETTPSCYQAADLFVFPTLVSEGQSLAMLEAMASGLACVASFQDSMEESFPPEVLSLVKDANIHAQFVAPITALLGDETARTEMAQIAREFVVRRHSKEIAMPQIEQFFWQQLNLVGGVS